MCGLCRSLMFFPSSLREPTTFISPHFSHSHIGSGIPQYLCLDTGQSPRLSSQFLNLSPDHDGFQKTFAFSFNSWSLISVTLKNHCGTEIKMSAVLHLQQNGYSCSIIPSLKRSPLLFISSII